jgi:GTPase SAR1 family protein
MGNRLCGPASRSMEAVIDAEINKMLREEEKYIQANQVKVLFLGGCNAGKSTFIASLLRELDPATFALRMKSAEPLVEASFSQFAYVWDTETDAAKMHPELMGLAQVSMVAEKARWLLFADVVEKMGADFYEIINSPLATPFCRADIERICAGEQMSESDYLRSRVRTTGINNFDLEMNGKLLSLVETGFCCVCLGC